MRSLAARAWLTVGLLWTVALLNYLDRLMIASMRDPLKADIVMNDAQFGLLTSVFLWIYGILSPVGGFLADRFSRRWTIVGSLFVWSAVTWATGHVHSLGGMLVTRGLMGLSEACYIPAALALIADYHPGPTRSLATGLHMTGIYAGAALGGIGGVIAEYYGWRAGFQWFGAFGVCYAGILTALLRDAERAPTQPASGEIAWRSAMQGLFKARAFWLLLAANACIGIANWGINGWLPTYLREHFKLGLGAAGMTATGYIQIASFVGVICGGIWADRWSQTQPRARVLVPAIGLCVVAPCLFISINAELLAVAIAGLVIYGLGRGFIDANLMPALRTVVDQRLSATGYGLLNFVGVWVGGALILRRRLAQGLGRRPRANISSRSCRAVDRRVPVACDTPGRRGEFENSR
jgi:MFS family permease